MPKKTADWMSYAVGCILDQWRGDRLEGCVRLHLTAVMPRPKRLQRKRDPEGRVWCDAHPDCDNISKAACDALTKAGVWKDDKQVVSETIDKFYEAKSNDKPQLVIDIYEVAQDDPGFW